jgi:EAL domain-containing protein (putative c-di-GMP-specific phosphodiesterase class I)
MAKRLKLRVIAEGVENRAQLDFLRANHCEAFQGYSSRARSPRSRPPRCCAPRPRALHRKPARNASRLVYRTCPILQLEKGQVRTNLTH